MSDNIGLSTYKFQVDKPVANQRYPGCWSFVARFFPGDGRCLSFQIFIGSTHGRLERTGVSTRLLVDPISRDSYYVMNNHAFATETKGEEQELQHLRRLKHWVDASPVAELVERLASVASIGEPQFKDLCGLNAA
ncbi:hypothetical protein [Synechococcus sp. PCC 7335]|uniref:hypothetical protein n=1 Tax=Synechococcus sp. (strain ATCC 29403 / PCC 7335) TaxID=91464 RepID=UPI0012FB21E0|nr:hypothetical protein [Synechococcus sp. PCC 7335]